MMGLGGALFEAIDFADGQIRNASLSQYRVPRLPDLPQVEVVLLDRPDQPSAGGGETPIVAVAPAIANAIFSACGTRLRSMPLAPSGKVPRTTAVFIHRADGRRSGFRDIPSGLARVLDGPTTPQTAPRRGWSDSRGVTGRARGVRGWARASAADRVERHGRVGRQLKRGGGDVLAQVRHRRRAGDQQDVR
jgi:hypothetical protein